MARPGTGVAVRLAVIAAASLAACASPDEGSVVTLGQLIFFDENLSEPRGQSCAHCHAPETGFTGPDPSINARGAVMPGATAAAFGSRKPPTVAYASASPPLDRIFDGSEWLFQGGILWDGRATGWTLGSPAAEQATVPFINPSEQNLAGKAEVVARICDGRYGALFRQVWGRSACDAAGVDAAYDRVGLSIAAYEASPLVNRYSSRFDRFLRGQERLTAREQRGYELFAGKAKCAVCHVLEPADRPVFTENAFYNIGIPRNPQNPVYASRPDYVDEGLGGFLASADGSPEYTQYAAENRGKQRIPTVRNVDKRPSPGFVKAYGHNGYFKSLEQIVHFYNTRDVLNGGRPCPRDFSGEVGVWCWPAPEVPDNVNRDDMGSLELTPDEEAAVVAFLRTLSDD